MELEGGCCQWRGEGWALLASRGVTEGAGDYRGRRAVVAVSAASALVTTHHHDLSQFGEHGRRCRLGCQHRSCGRGGGEVMYCMRLSSIVFIPRGGVHRLVQDCEHHQGFLGLFSLIWRPPFRLDVHRLHNIMVCATITILSSILMNNVGASWGVKGTIASPPPPPPQVNFGSQVASTVGVYAFHKARTW